MPKGLKLWLMRRMRPTYALEVINNAALGESTWTEVERYRSRNRARRAMAAACSRPGSSRYWRVFDLAEDRLVLEMERRHGTWSYPTPHVPPDIEGIDPESELARNVERELERLAHKGHAGVRQAMVRLGALYADAIGRPLEIEKSALREQLDAESARRRFMQREGRSLTYAVRDGETRVRVTETLPDEGMHLLAETDFYGDPDAAERRAIDQAMKCLGTITEGSASREA